MTWDFDELVPVLTCVTPMTEVVLAAGLPSRGLEVVAKADRAIELVELAVSRPDGVAVLDLTLAGRLGLRAIDLLASVSPGLRLVVVVPFPGLVVDALKRGADRAVLLDDATGLLAAVSELRVVSEV
jgi:ActR/RegA family two-component response regulator